MIRLALAATLAAILGWATPDAEAAGRTLNVYGWADYVDPALLDAFSAETGITVTYDAYDRPETAEARLRSPGSGYDLAIVPADLVAALASSRVLKPFDRAGLPRAAGTAPDLADRLRAYDPGGLAAPYLWGTVGLGYVPEAVRQRLGERSVESWDLLFRSDAAARLKDCGIGMPDRAADVLPGALRALGYAGDSRNPAELQKAADAVMRMRPAVRKFGGGEQATALASGDLCLAIVTSTDVAHVRQRMGEDRAPIAYAVPKEGAPVWFDVFVLPADAADPEAAHALVDYLSRPDIAARNAVALGGASAVAGARALMPSAVQDDPVLFPRDDAMKRLFAVPAPDARVQPVIDRLWARVKAGK
jgi:putrescine transport system substrate-binding protein